MPVIVPVRSKTESLSRLYPRPRTTCHVAREELDVNAIEDETRKNRASGEGRDLKRGWRKNELD